MVAEAVALGVPDAKLGQAVCLAIRPIGEGEVATLQKALAQTLPNFMQPRVIRAYSELPRNPNGKIDRTRIALEFAA
jgi:acyl-coenzyme A synthetase/AMP-(fatty) acid ligase